MSHRKRLREYRSSVAELERRIRLCGEYKTKIFNFLAELDEGKRTGRITNDLYFRLLDKSFGEKKPVDWVRYYEDEADKARSRITHLHSEMHESRKTVRNSNLKILAAAFFVLFMIVAGIFIMKPGMTGFVVNLGSREMAANYTSSYDVEGTKWADIMGSRLYERCLKVESEIAFDSVLISAEVAVVTDRKGLTYGIYNNSEYDEPDAEIGSCIVDDYSGAWKSCMIDNLDREKGEYWLCAYSPDGDTPSTYYTIMYDNGGTKKRALWTGKYWQLLERASYSINADFIKWK